jgi:hypothetical protein
LDEDNDKLTYYYYALHSGNRAISVISYHYQWDTGELATIQKTVLESLQAMPQAAADRPETAGARK